MNKPLVLFNSVMPSSLSATRDAEVHKEIQAYDADMLLATDVGALSRYLIERHRFDLPRLREDEICITKEETTVRKSRGLGYIAGPTELGVVVQATSITYHVPFDGDRLLFRAQPSTYGYSIPDAVIADGELMITYKRTSEPAETLKAEFERDLNGIRTALTYLAGDLAREDARFSTNVAGWIEQRRSALTSANALVN